MPAAPLSLSTHTQAEVYLVVEEVETSGVSVNTRATITATAMTDTASAMNTVVRCITGIAIQRLRERPISTPLSSLSAHQRLRHSSIPVSSTAPLRHERDSVMAI